jgi:hypothetical protein
MCVSITRTAVQRGPKQDGFESERIRRDCAAAPADGFTVASDVSAIPQGAKQAARRAGGGCGAVPETRRPGNRPASFPSKTGGTDVAVGECGRCAMCRFFQVSVCVTAAVLALAADAVAEPTSRCADCHYAQITPPNADHLLDWERSAHARHNVGCERCHGGNAGVFEAFLAHDGVLDSSNRRSPVHRANLPATCGRCHVGPFVGFQESRHYELLESRIEDGPTCSTCHDPVAGQLLSPKALESQCARCHGPAEVAPAADRAKHAREMYEALHAVRSQLKIARQMIKKVGDKQRQADLMDLYSAAEVPVTRAVDAGHSFIYDELQAHLVTAQQRVDRLMAALGNRMERKDFP